MLEPMSTSPAPNLRVAAAQIGAGVARRLVMIKDVKAPADIITSRILDLEAYPRMVKGCDYTQNYEVS